MRHVTKSQSGLKLAVGAAQIKACGRLGLLNPKIRAMPGIDAPVVKSNLHSALGLTLHSAKKMLERHGIDLKKGTREVVEIPEEVVAKIKRELENAVSLDEAARQLGCSAEDIDLVAVKLAKKGWDTCVQTRHEDGLRRRILVAELRKLTDTLQALPLASKGVQTVGIGRRARREYLSETRLMADALRGTITAFQDPHNEGLRGLRFYKVKRGMPASIGRTNVPADAMLWSEFYAMTGVPASGIRRLKAGGHLEQHPAKSSYVTRESALAFCDRYISPIRCFQADGMDFSSASAAVQALDLPIPFSRKEFGLTLVERRRFVTLFPHHRRPSAKILRFWEQLVHLGRENCPSFIIPELPGTGRFTIFPTSRILPAYVIVRENGIFFEIEVRPHFRRLWKTFEDLGKDFKTILGSFDWEEAADMIRITNIVTDVEGLEKVTKEFGRLNEHFRYKMP